MPPNGVSPPPALTVKSDDGAHVEFHQFSMWDESRSEFLDPPAEYHQLLVDWLYDKFDAYNVDLDGAYIYLRAMALPGPSLRPFKIAGRIVVWLSPDDGKSVTNAGTMQSMGSVPDDVESQVDDEDYASLVRYTLPTSRALEEVFLNCFKRAKALTYLGDHLVVEMPPGEAVPDEYQCMKFQIPVSFTNGPLFERFALENTAAALATGAQCGLRRLATPEGRSSWLEVDRPLRYNDSVFVSKFPPRYQHLSCQGLRVVRRDKAEASDASQIFAQYVFVTGKIFRESPASPPIPPAAAAFRCNGKICPLFLPPLRRKSDHPCRRRRRISSLDGSPSAADPLAVHTNYEQQVIRNARAVTTVVTASPPKVGFPHGIKLAGDGRIYTQVVDSDGIYGSFYDYSSY